MILSKLNLALREFFRETHFETFPIVFQPRRGWQPKPSSECRLGCGIDAVPESRRAAPEQIFSWYSEDMQARLKLPSNIIDGRCDNDFLNFLTAPFEFKNDDWSAVGRPSNNNKLRVILFNSSCEFSPDEEQITFLHEVAHCLGFLKHDRYFLAMMLVLVFRSGYQNNHTLFQFQVDCALSEDEIADKKIAEKWAEKFAQDNCEQDKTALEIADELLLIMHKELGVDVLING